MLVCSVVVRTQGFGSVKDNPRRIAEGQRLVRWAEEKGACLVVFPAGFLTAKRGPARTIATPILQTAKDVGVGVLLGVDEGDRRLKHRAKTDVCRSLLTLPFFVIGWAPGMRQASIWRQRATTRRLPRPLVDAEGRARTLLVGRSKVAVVACGEGFSPAIQVGLNVAAPDLVVMLAHTAARSRHWQALDRIAGVGLPVLRAVHAHGDAQNVMRIHQVRIDPALAGGTADFETLKAALFDVKAAKSHGVRS